MNFWTHFRASWRFAFCAGLCIVLSLWVAFSRTASAQTSIVISQARSEYIYQPPNSGVVPSTDTYNVNVQFAWNDGDAEPAATGYPDVYWYRNGNYYKKQTSTFKQRTVDVAGNVWYDCYDPYDQGGMGKYFQAGGGGLLFGGTLSSRPSGTRKICWTNTLVIDPRSADTADSAIYTAYIPVLKAYTTPAQVVVTPAAAPGSTVKPTLNLVRSPKSKFVGAGGSVLFWGDADSHVGGLLQNPFGVTVDGDGMVYIADSLNHVIRRVTPGGKGRTLAGLDGAILNINTAAFNQSTKYDPTLGLVTGTLVTASANGPSVWKFSSLQGITVGSRLQPLDPNNSVLYADNSKGSFKPAGSGRTELTVRSVDTTNNNVVVTEGLNGTKTVGWIQFNIKDPFAPRAIYRERTLSSGTCGWAPKASFQDPNDKAGCYRYKETEDVTTEPRFNTPEGLVAADDGSIFVADTKNNAIERVWINSDGTTYAQTLCAGSQILKSPNLDVETNRGYYNQKLNSVSSINATGTAVLTVGTSTTGTINFPSAIAGLDGSGIWTVDPVFNGSGLDTSASLSDESLVVTKVVGGTVTLNKPIKYAGSKSITFTPYLPNRTFSLTAPRGLFFEGSMTDPVNGPVLYVLDFNSIKKLILNPGGTTVKEVVYIGSVTQAEGWQSGSEASRLYAPRGFVVSHEPDQDSVNWKVIYVADTMNHVIRKITLNDNFRAKFKSEDENKAAPSDWKSEVIAGVVGARAPVDATGTALIADYSNTGYYPPVVLSGCKAVDGGTWIAMSTIYGLPSSGPFTITLQGGTQKTVDRIALVKGGSLYGGSLILNASTPVDFSTVQNNKPVLEDGQYSFSLMTPSKSVPQANTSRLSYPSGLVMDPRGNLYFTEMGSHNVRRVVLDTNNPGVSARVEKVAGQSKAGPFDGSSGNGSGSSSLFFFPSSIACDLSNSPATSLLVADSANHAVRRITMGTVTSTVKADALKSDSDPTLLTNVVLMSGPPPQPWMRVSDSGSTITQGAVILSVTSSSVNSYTIRLSQPVTARLDGQTITFEQDTFSTTTALGYIGVSGNRDFASECSEYNYHWKRAGTNLVDYFSAGDGTGYFPQTNIFGAETAFLSLNHLRTADTGPYSLEISNNFDVSVQSAIASLYVTPTLADPAFQVTPYGLMASDDRTQLDHLIPEVGIRDFNLQAYVVPSDSVSYKWQIKTTDTGQDVWLDLNDTVSYKLNPKLTNLLGTDGSGGLQLQGTSEATLRVRGFQKSLLSIRDQALPPVEFRVICTPLDGSAASVSTDEAGNVVQPFKITPYYHPVAVGSGTMRAGSTLSSLEETSLKTVAADGDAVYLAANQSFTAFPFAENDDPNNPTVRARYRWMRSTSDGGDAENVPYSALDIGGLSSRILLPGTAYFTTGSYQVMVNNAGAFYEGMPISICSGSVVAGTVSAGTYSSTVVSIDGSTLTLSEKPLFSSGWYKLAIPAGECAASGFFTNQSTVPGTFESNIVSVSRGSGFYPGMPVVFGTFAGTPMDLATAAGTFSATVVSINGNQLTLSDSLTFPSTIPNGDVSGSLSLSANKVIKVKGDASTPYYYFLKLWSGTGDLSDTATMIGSPTQTKYYVRVAVETQATSGRIDYDQTANDPSNLVTYQLQDPNGVKVVYVNDPSKPFALEAKINNASKQPAYKWSYLKWGETPSSVSAVVTGTLGSKLLTVGTSNGLMVGQSISGTGIAEGSNITAISGNRITLSKPVTQAVTGNSFTATNWQPISIVGGSLNQDLYSGTLVAGGTVFAQGSTVTKPTRASLAFSSFTPTVDTIYPDISGLYRLDAAVDGAADSAQKYWVVAYRQKPYPRSASAYTLTVGGSQTAASVSTVDLNTQVRMSADVVFPLPDTIPMQNVYGGSIDANTVSGISLDQYATSGSKYTWYRGTVPLANSTQNPPPLLINEGTLFLDMSKGKESYLGLYSFSVSNVCGRVPNLGPVNYDSSNNKILGWTLLSNGLPVFVESSLTGSATPSAKVNSGLTLVSTSNGKVIQRVGEGQFVALEMPVKSSYPLSYSWSYYPDERSFSNGTQRTQKSPVPPNGKNSITDSKYIIRSASKSDSGVYQVTVQYYVTQKGVSQGSWKDLPGFSPSSSPGSDWPTLTLLVEPLPQVGVPKLKMNGKAPVVNGVINTVPFASSGTLTAVNLTGGTFSGAEDTKFYTFQWKKNGVPILGETRETLKLNSISKAQAGLYSVEVTSAAGSKTSPSLQLAVTSGSDSTYSVKVQNAGDIRYTIVPSSAKIAPGTIVTLSGMSSLTQTLLGWRVWDASGNGWDLPARGAQFIMPRNAVTISPVCGRGSVGMYTGFLSLQKPWGLKEWDIYPLLKAGDTAARSQISENPSASMVRGFFSAMINSMGMVSGRVMIEGKLYPFTTTLSFSRDGTYSGPIRIQAALLDRTPWVLTGTISLNMGLRKNAILPQSTAEPSDLIQILDADNSEIDLGMSVSGYGIVDGTTIIGIREGNQVQLSNAASLPADSSNQDGVVPITIGANVAALDNVMHVKLDDVVLELTPPVMKSGRSLYGVAASNSGVTGSTANRLNALILKNDGVLPAAGMDIKYTAAIYRFGLKDATSCLGRGGVLSTGISQLGMATILGYLPNGAKMTYSGYVGRSCYVKDTQTSDPLDLFSEVYNSGDSAGGGSDTTSINIDVTGVAMNVMKEMLERHTASVSIPIWSSSPAGDKPQEPLFGGLLISDLNIKGCLGVLNAVPLLTSGTSVPTITVGSGAASYQILAGSLATASEYTHNLVSGYFYDTTTTSGWTKPNPFTQTARVSLFTTSPTSDSASYPLEPGIDFSKYGTDTAMGRLTYVGSAVSFIGSGKLGTGSGLNLQMDLPSGIITGSFLEPTKRYVSSTTVGAPWAALGATGISARTFKTDSLNVKFYAVTIQGGSEFGYLGANGGAVGVMIRGTAIPETLKNVLGNGYQEVYAPPGTNPTFRVEGFNMNAVEPN